MILIKDDSVLPFLKDRRVHVVTLLDILNKLRRDAHAITVSDDELASARSAFDYLEAEFSAP